MNSISDDGQGLIAVPPALSPA